MLEARTKPTIEECLGRQQTESLVDFVNYDEDFLNSDWNVQQTDSLPSLEKVMTVFEMLEMIDYLEPGFEGSADSLQETIEEWLIARVK